MIVFKLADTELEGSEAYLTKLGKICRRISNLWTRLAKIRFSINADISSAYISTRKSIIFSKSSNIFHSGC